MDLTNKKILVTGADGFIGSHLVEYLVSLGLDVRAFVYYNSFGSWGWLDHSPQNVKDNLDVFAGDIRDPNGVYTAMEGCDVVFHLAALIAIPFSYHSPDSYIDTNVKGTLNILQAARKVGVERIIHTSTSEVYGTAQYVPIDETHPLQGQSPYSASKIGADHLALSFYKSFDVPVTVVRPFNAFGPRQSARAVIPTIITQLLAGKDAISLGAIHPTRDFTFVKDTVKGFVDFCQTDNIIGDVTNLGSGFEISIKETASLIAEVMGKDVHILEDKQRLRPDKSEVERLFASTDKMNKDTNFKPNYGGIDGFKKGIEETIGWFSNPDNTKSYKVNSYNI